MICSECGGNLLESTEIIAAQFRDELVEVEGIPHLVCSDCGEIEFDLESTSLYSDAVKNASVLE